MTYKDRKKADFDLHVGSLEILFFSEESLYVKIKAIPVSILFKIRLIIGWHSIPNSWISFRWHGNYCGPGHSDQDKKPIDKLDSICKKHDESVGYKRNHKSNI